MGLPPPTIDESYWQSHEPLPPPPQPITSSEVPVEREIIIVSDPQIQPPPEDPDEPGGSIPWTAVNIAMPNAMLTDIDKWGPRNEVIRQLIILGLSYYECHGPIEQYPMVVHEPMSVSKLMSGM
jgi:hypothetical protein